MRNYLIGLLTLVVSSLLFFAAAPAAAKDWTQVNACKDKVLTLNGWTERDARRLSTTTVAKLPDGRTAKIDGKPLSHVWEACEQHVTAPKAAPSAVVNTEEVLANRQQEIEKLRKEKLDLEAQLADKPAPKVVKATPLWAWFALVVAILALVATGLLFWRMREEAAARRRDDTRLADLNNLLNTLRHDTPARTEILNRLAEQEPIEEIIRSRKATGHAFGHERSQDDVRPSPQGGGH